ncbi:required for respiratory growth protein 9, mitochondrial [Rhinocladiella mackenziei CBS 650.93]|uniref:Required for respiratory growth protein 9, mitochondrial n=1 Tax=Rhinocladiella mackenziei CBS 650.93 TaxID=1442369 RepID=A0A0D2GUY7_9EURO|nr:required for respiratory growth protein 9, mitochondrial [Rhinocladiella mackenziei CBS 650.93]KIX02078.1 required for respiratory growth protein 9, mitochondrial [Rhinocladiella mackenziei CBS 650.93]
MTLNSQNCARIFWTVARSSRLPRRLTPPAYSHPRIPQIKYRPSTESSCQPSSSTNAREFCSSVHHRRRGQSGQDVEEETVEDFQPSDSKDQNSKRTASTETEEDDSIMVISRHNYRDKDGRLWLSPTEENEVGGAGRRRKQKKLTLKDLAIPKEESKGKKNNREREPWQIQKEGLKKKFGEEGWNPRKKLSPDAMEGIRALHEQDPEKYSTPVLAETFKVSPEAIRRILKSKWRPTEEEMEKRRQRWARRHDRIWDHLSELGLRPKRITEREIEDPNEFDEKLRAQEILDNARDA